MLVLVLLLGLQDAPNQADIEKAIKLGADALLARVGPVLAGDEGINQGEGYEFSPLVLYTLVHSGIPLDHEEMQRLISRVESAPLLRTYQVALTAAALAAINPSKYHHRLVNCAQYLVDYQADNGQWGYGDKYEFAAPAAKTESKTISTVRIRRSKKLGGQVGDNSNSQYAALGLRACAWGGCDIEGATLTKAIEWWEKSQLKSGGWAYDSKGVTDEKAAAYGSMTAGAVSSLIMLKKLKKQDLKGSTVLNRGFWWLGKNFSVEENPGSPAGLEDWRYYYLYAIERAGDLYPTDEIGKQDWYAIGSAHLVKAQRSNGTWIAKNPKFTVPDTCFALLFLERVARRPPVATGGKSPEPAPEK